jgi:hypothetical protein
MDYLVKPIEKDKLLAVAEEAVQKHILFKDQFNAWSPQRFTGPLKG